MNYTKVIPTLARTSLKFRFLHKQLGLPKPVSPSGKLMEEKKNTGRYLPITTGYLLDWKTGNVLGILRKWKKKLKVKKNLEI